MGLFIKSEKVYHANAHLLIFELVCISIPLYIYIYIYHLSERKIATTKKVHYQQNPNICFTTTVSTIFTYTEPETLNPNFTLL